MARPTPTANTFANIDGLLREWGFTLFDLDLWRYSRRSLPDKFVYRLAGQTVTGQVQWGEAVYFRELARPDYEQMHGFAPGLAKKIKLACLLSCTVCRIVRRKSWISCCSRRETVSFQRCWMSSCRTIAAAGCPTPNSWSNSTRIRSDFSLVKSY